MYSTFHSTVLSVFLEPSKQKMALVKEIMGSSLLDKTPLILGAASSSSCRLVLNQRRLLFHLQQKAVGRSSSLIFTHRLIMFWINFDFFRNQGSQEKQSIRAILVTNKHQQEFFLESITMEGFARGPLHFPCDSWVQSSKHHPAKRVFFSNQPYLPHETPAGLKALRERELRELRGDGNGERKLSDRIYDFDVCNDLGNADKGIEFARPILGGQEIPYPRRCRTGRPATYTNLNAESRVEKPLPMYVPRDEQFEESKMTTFSTGRLKAVLHNLIPQLMASISANNKDFKGFSDIDSLYSEGLLLKFSLHDEILNKIPMPETVNKIQKGGLLKFDLPKIVSKDKYAWLRDDGFGRQALAGINPVNIERLQGFPPVSKLDPETYGSPESALKEEQISHQLNGMTVQEALNANRLYIIDY